MTNLQLQTKLMPLQAFVYKRLKGSQPERIHEVAAELEELSIPAKGHFQNHYQNILWLMALCFHQLKHSERATDLLLELSSELDNTRRHIKNPAQRAELHGRYKNLYRILTELQFSVASPEIVLQTIEAGKGRFLSESLFGRSNDAISYQAIAKSIVELKHIVQYSGVHYISFLVDQYYTYAVLVSKEGRLHKARIPINEIILNDLINQINPQTWSRRTSLLKSSEVRRLDESLKGLLGWLEPLHKEGVIEKGDHICYFADGLLHLIPLHYLRFMDAYLPEYFSMSKVSGIHLLLKILGKEPVRPKSFVGVQVASKSDIAFDSKIKSLAIVPNWLQKHLPGNLFLNEQANWKQLFELKLSNQLIHFTTHGIFDPTQQSNPIENSGLLLANDGQLPSIPLEIRAVEKRHLLSPQVFLEQTPQLKQSHISLMACVSGLSTEGGGRDPLGLDWVCEYLGADSILSSHWNIDAQLAGTFFTGFYKRWLLDKKPRFRAWRETILEIMQLSENNMNDPYSWGAFSLTGDWR